MWKNGARLYMRINNRAQALLELAVLGTILIMLLGVLVNYGIRYNEQQKVEQQAFRRALHNVSGLRLSAPIGSLVTGGGVNLLDIVGSRGSASYMMIKDYQVPDPSDPWAVGSVQPAMASANIVRDANMHKTADLPSELPETIMDINGRVRSYKTAGMRVSATLNTEYEKEVYGTVWAPLQDYVNENIIAGPVVIQDSADGEIMDFDVATRQCRMIVDPIAFERECIKNMGPGTAFQAVKDPKVLLSCVWVPTVVPWYCKDGELINPDFGARTWVFPKIEEMKARTSPAAGMSWAMGVQPDYTQNITAANATIKEENSQGIKTTDTVDWRDATQRKIVHIEKYPLGFALGGGSERSVEETPDTSEAKRQDAQVWQTEWR